MLPVYFDCENFESFGVLSCESEELRVDIMGYLLVLWMQDNNQTMLAKYSDHDVSPITGDHIYACATSAICVDGL